MTYTLQGVMYPYSHTRKKRALDHVFVSLFKIGLKINDNSR